MEGWQSGLTRHTWNVVSGQPDRGFDSHPLRLRLAEARQGVGGLRLGFGATKSAQNIRLAFEFNAAQLIVICFMDKETLEIIKQYLFAYQAPRRRALSSRYPQFLTPIIFIKKTFKDASNIITIGSKPKIAPFLPYCLAEHSSLLLRKLGTTDQQLQVNKVKNLEIAIKKLKT